MVDDDYTDKEEAIKFNDQDNNDDDDNDNNDDNDGDDDGNGDDNLYITDIATMEKKRKKGARLKLKSLMSKKWHKSKGTNNTSINYDAVMLSGKGDPDFEGDADGNLEGDADGEDSDDDIDFFQGKAIQKNKSQKLDNAQKRTTREGDSSNPVHWAGRVF